MSNDWPPKFSSEARRKLQEKKLDPDLIRKLEKRVAQTAKWRARNQNHTNSYRAMRELRDALKTAMENHPPNLLMDMEPVCEMAPLEIVLERLHDNVDWWVDKESRGGGQSKKDRCHLVRRCLIDCRDHGISFEPGRDRTRLQHVLQIVLTEAGHKPQKDFSRYISGEVNSLVEYEKRRAERITKSPPQKATP